MKTILVPLDGSALAEQVLPYVGLLAPLLDAEVRLLRVIADLEQSAALPETIAATYGIEQPLATRLHHQQRGFSVLREQAEEYLVSQARLLQAAGVEVSIDVGGGQPASRIVETAEAIGASLIVMATHGYSGLRRWALGSVSDKVAHAATMPVLLVRHAVARPALRRIMVPLDGSPLAAQALPLATELARSAQAKLLLLRAVAPSVDAILDATAPGYGDRRYGDILAALHKYAQQELDDLATQLVQQEITAEAAVFNGPAAEVIVDEASRQQVDLVVMATHGYGGLRRWALGSVTDKVIQSSSTPLLLVRAQG